MDTYLVGGAVRDKQLGLTVTERDWVVVGATEAEMIELGFTRVGKDFPVFLHPKTKEEYALARKERKIATGHQGFECDASADVTLEEDLMRRDLTVNAIAETPDGTLIDPYGGLQDIKAKRLKHVSSAFEEDPLRILRVARFYARFAEFDVDPSTLQMMTRMTGAKALAELSPERIYAEVDKILHTDTPHRAFTLLNEIGAHDYLWPEISQQGIALLTRIEAKTEKPDFRFAALLEGCSAEQLKALTTRLRLPKKLFDLALMAAGNFELWKSLEQLEASDIVDWFYDRDSFRRPERQQDLNNYFDLLAELNDNNPYGDKWQALFALVANISAQVIKRKKPDLSGPAFGEALRDERIMAVEKWQQQNSL